MAGLNDVSTGSKLKKRKRSKQASASGSGQSHFQLAFQKIEETDTELRSEGMNFNFAAAAGISFPSNDTSLFEEYEDSAKAAGGDSTTATTNEGADDALANNTQLQFVRLSNALFVPGRKHPAFIIKSNQELKPLPIVRRKLNDNVMSEFLIGNTFARSLLTKEEANWSMKSLY